MTGIKILNEKLILFFEVIYLVTLVLVSFFRLDIIVDYWSYFVLFTILLQKIVAGHIYLIVQIRKKRGFVYKKMSRQYDLALLVEIIAISFLMLLYGENKDLMIFNNVPFFVLLIYFSNYSALTNMIEKSIRNAVDDWWLNNSIKKPRISLENKKRNIIRSSKRI